MTENECVETLQYLLGYENAVDVGEIDEHNCLNSQEKEALKFILEEIQQYRTIGTVEEVAEMSNSYINYFHKVRKYQAIGTIEEFKALKEKNEEVLLKDGQLLYQQGLVDGYAKAIDEFVKKLIERLEENTIQHKEAINLFNKYGIKFVSASKVKEIVNQLAEEHKGGWIPCSERLPGEYEYALVWCKGYFASGTHIGEECQWYGIGLLYNKNKWEVYQCKDIKDIEVLGWQPLPEPYKECEKQ